MLENFSTLIESPTSFFALVGVLVLIFFSLQIQRVKLTTKMLINIALLLALATVLSYLRIYHFPQGGSVTLGAMVPMLLVALRYGAGVGALAGFVFGLINLLQDPFILHPVQVLFDYPLPFMAMGLAGFLRAKKFLATILAFCGRFACHFISGVIFFASYAPEGMSPVIYSLAANATCLVPEMLLSLAILKFLPVQRLLDAMK